MENKKNKTSEIEKANSEEVLTVTETVLETDENSDTCIAETELYSIKIGLYRYGLYNVSSNSCRAA